MNSPQVVIPERDTEHSPQPNRKKPRSSQVVLLFTRSEHIALSEQVEASEHSSQAAFIRAALTEGLGEFEALVKACEPSADEALHLDEEFRLQELSPAEIGRKRHEEQGEEVLSKRRGRRKRFGRTQDEERGHVRYALRLTEEEYETTQDAAESIGLTTGGLIWRLLCGYPLFSLRMSTYESWSDVERTAYAVKALSIGNKG